MFPWGRRGKRKGLDAVDGGGMRVGKAIKIKTLIMSLIAVFGGEVALGIGLLTTSFDRMLLVGLARLLQTGAIIGSVLILEEGLAAIGLERHTLYKGLKSGLLWSAGFGSAVLAAIGLLSLAGVDLRSLVHTPLPAGPKAMLLFFGVGGIAAPLAEEVFFRGILYGFFRRWGFMIALVFSTGSFVLAHSLKGGIPVTRLVGGVLFAVAYEVEGKLLTPAVIHALGNLGIFAVSLVF